MKWFDAKFLPQWFLPMLASLISMPKRKMTDFFTTGIATGSVTPSRPTSTGSVPTATSISVDVEIHVDGEEAPRDLDQIEFEVVQETAQETPEISIEFEVPVVQETAQPQETSAISKKPKFDHQFQEKWRAKWAWLVKNDDGIGMTCEICSKCDKSNSFTTGCKNYRTSTIERHVITHDHQEAVKAQTMQRGFLQASLGNSPNCTICHRQSVYLGPAAANIWVPGNVQFNWPKLFQAFSVKFTVIFFMSVFTQSFHISTCKYIIYAKYCLLSTLIAIK